MSSFIRESDMRIDLLNCALVDRARLTRGPRRCQEVVAKRLATFYETTSPLLKYYATQAVTPHPMPSSSSSSKLSSPSAVHTQSRQAGHTESVILHSIAGRTSDEIWPRLEETVLQNFGVGGRGVAKSTGHGGAKSSHTVEREIDISSAGVAEKGNPTSVSAGAATSA